MGEYFVKSSTSSCLENKVKSKDIQNIFYILIYWSFHRREISLNAHSQCLHFVVGYGMAPVHGATVSGTAVGTGRLTKPGGKMWSSQAPCNILVTDDMRVRQWSHRILMELKNFCCLRHCTHGNTAICITHVFVVMLM